MKQKDIWLVNLNPTRGREQRGIRPVVIISGNVMNDNFHSSIVCPLSSKIKNFAGCILLEKDKHNHLKNDSEIITFQVRIISHERFIKKIGEISDAQLKEAVVGLNEILKY